MSGTGRPLRFLAGVSAGWIVLRITMLWPEIDSIDDLTRAIVPLAMAKPPPEHVVAVRSPTPPHQATLWRLPLGGPVLANTIKPDPDRVALALVGLVRFGTPQAAEPGPGLVAGLPPPAAAKPRSSRWSGSVWLIARGGSGASGGLVGGQLGGSQGGVRIAYALDAKRRVAIAGRVTAPLGPGLREASIGVEWRPTRLPVRLVAERRFAINGGSGATAIGLVGGFGPVALPHGLRVEGYGQAGAIDRAGVQGFADGSLRAAAPIARLAGIKFDLGGGAWGAAQKGATRLDIGPSLGAVLKLGPQPIRLSLDWRQRVAGAARPGSGVALTLGADF